jgi:hypothetical protein
MMFRPLTFVTLVLACGSGLYLYQVKHQAQMLDKQIDRAVKAIEATRAQAREMSAEWTLEGNPSRLQDLVTQFLPTDQPVQPSQFIGLADLDSHLPPPRSLDTPPAEPDGGTDGGPAGTPDGASAAVMSEATPVPSVSPSLPVAAMATATISAAPIDAPHIDAPHVTEPAKAPSPPPSLTSPPLPAVAQNRPVDRKPVDAPRPPRDLATQAPAPRPAPRPMPQVAELERLQIKLRAAAPTPPAPIALSGSMLGMAHGSSLPPPRPMPVSTGSAYYGNQ